MNDSGASSPKRQSSSVADTFQKIHAGGRVDSWDSITSETDTTSLQSKRASNAHTMRSNMSDTTVRTTRGGTFNECGRHSNEWLFNGVKISDSIKKLFEKRG